MKKLKNAFVNIKSSLKAIITALSNNEKFMVFFKVIVHLVGILICFICWDSSRWEPYFVTYYEDVGYFFEDVGVYFPFIPTSYKKFRDILAAFIWYFVDVEITFKHYGSIAFVTGVAVIIDIYVENPKKDYFFLFCLILRVIWVCYYFW